ncbi:MAG: hypothetical protein BAJALOKI3v1_50002 [Promethearchaeota archaeon]|nr:MAG: hypothetical protein BAJALOKI3v1_50002 [Candidatus Lokiarchaeota archaeon]
MSTVDFSNKNKEIAMNNNDLYIMKNTKDEFFLVDKRNMKIITPLYCCKNFEEAVKLSNSLGIYPSLNVSKTKDGRIIKE